MSDIGEMYKDLRAEAQERKRQNKVNATLALVKAGVKFTSHNDGVHLIVESPNGLIDYWPSTGKFITRKGVHGRGVNAVLKLCKTEGPQA